MNRKRRFAGQMFEKASGFFYFLPFHSLSSIYTPHRFKSNPTESMTYFPKKE